MKLSEQIRRAIESCGKTRYRIAKETGISESMLSCFMHGTANLSMDALDRLAEYIGLTVALKKRSK